MGIPDGQPVVLTHRQWVILQRAMAQLTFAVAERTDGLKSGGPLHPCIWYPDDGELPRSLELKQLTETVYTMQHTGKPGTPKTVRCGSCQDRPGFDGLGRACKPCNGKGVRVEGVW